MKNGKSIVLVAAAGVVLLLAYAWASPYLALGGIRKAILNNNPTVLERYVDFPRVRDSLKAQLNAAMMEEVQKDDTRFAALGMALATNLINSVVDAYVTPEGLASVGTSQEPKKGDLAAIQQWQIKRQGFSRVLIHPKDNPYDGLVMERQGMSWKVVRLQINLRNQP